MYTAAGVFTQATWANAKSAGSFYGITPQQSAATGLPAFDAGSGWIIGSLGLLWSIDLSQEWIVVGSMDSRRLHEDAAHSPFAERRPRLSFLKRAPKGCDGVCALELLPLYDAVARIKARGHWQSDVIVGFGVGTLAGYYAHNREQPLFLELLPHRVAIGLRKRWGVAWASTEITRRGKQE